MKCVDQNICMQVGVHGSNTGHGDRLHVVGGPWRLFLRIHLHLYLSRDPSL